MSNKLSVSESLAASLRKDIETGILTDGERLPSCRDMAVKLGINPNTVQKAYSALEKQGYLEILPQKGAYARKSPMHMDKPSAEKLAEERITLIRRSGISREKLEEIINTIYGEHDD